jgi:hypothetical protein
VSISARRSPSAALTRPSAPSRAPVAAVRSPICIEARTQALGREIETGARQAGSAVTEAFERLRAGTDLLQGLADLARHGAHRLDRALEALGGIAEGGPHLCAGWWPSRSRR